jgi:arylsulfatase
LLPTLVELCRLQARVPTDGASLAGVLHDEHAILPDRKLVVQYGEPKQGDATVIWDRWRLVRGTELYHIGDDPGQQQDIAEAHPDIVREMRAHYEAWWDNLGPEVTALERIGVGSERENPLCLNHVDWRGPILSYQSQVRSLFDYSPTLGFEDTRAVSDFNGVWHLRIEHGGDYEIALQRWPREAGAPLAGALPENIPTDTTFYGLPQPGMDEAVQMRWAWVGASSMPGQALPIAGARCKVGEYDRTISVCSDDTAAVFTLSLPAGDFVLQTWFLDGEGGEICGAFYVYITRSA